MKRIMIICLIGTLLMTMGCTPKYSQPLEDMTFCTTTDECTTVIPRGCCQCPVAINSRYLNQIDQTIENCDAVRCAACPDFVVECVSGKCALRTYRER
ncbi:hypothetical protein JW968_05605 [Candidatus Woesearchaeota archaeon]|nr:hypothetical protein [Candidatus Woesearchaeota archaeon]